MATTPNGANNCMRCGGLMVGDFYPDQSIDVSEDGFTARRCVQCGEIVDSVILKNRQLREAPPTHHSTATPASQWKLGSQHRTYVTGSSR